MAENLRYCRVFVASPSDVAEEREIARKVISETGRDVKKFGEITIEACGWEDVRPGLGRAQALINPLVKQADLLVGILWKRFGTNTGVAESGTQEEFDIMYKRWQAKEPVDVLIYFRDVPRDMLEDSGPQLQKVLEFRERFKRIGLYNTYEQPQQFADILRQHLVDWVAAQGRGVARGKRPRQKGRRGYAERPRSALLGRFLNSQVAEHKYLQMTGFETRIRMPIELERVIVPVRARFAEYSQDIPGRGLLLEKLQEAGVAAEAPVDFDTAWQEARSKKIKTLVILGQPGSGKTTLLRRLLLRAISDHKKLGFSSPVVPLLLPLRLVKQDEILSQAIHRILQADRLGLPGKFFDRELRSGDAFLLFDGLDEVASPTAREKVADWVRAQRKFFPSCPMVVTSRFAGYVGKARLEGPHIELALERFKGDEIRDFLKRWFVTVETALGEDTEFFRRRGRELAEVLADRIMNEPEIFILATNPLMLQIIALVHRDRGTLPERRVELYDECTNVLLEHWDRAKGGIDIPVTAREARGVLEPVAYWMHQVPDRRYASASMLLPLLRRELAKFPKKNVKPREFLSTIRDRSGLFVGHGVDEYGFQHLSFQEYLAANQVPQGNHLKELVSRYGESWWQEVTRLLMGVNKPNSFEPFMDFLVSSERFINNHSLTAACIRDAFQPTAGPFVSALDSTFKARGKNTDLAVLQYHLLLALKELPKKLLGRKISRLKRAANEGLSPEVRALASELLASFGVEVKVETDVETGLKKVRINPIDATELVLIQAGEFWRGSEGMANNPPKKDFLSDFYLARYPVTNAQYKKYLAANPGAEKPEYWDDERFNQPEQPVVGVSARKAEAYCQWARLRLPIEWEWEKGARGADGMPYPWGKEKPTKELANFNRNVGHPTAVGSYPKGASPYGLMDMAGNVWEWTASVYEKDKAGTEWRTLRGGSFGSDAGFLRAAYRFYSHPDGRFGVIGFRCAQDP